MRHQANDRCYERICDIKVQILPETLAEGYSKQFASRLEYTASLRLEETPRYSVCVQLLNDLLTARGETFDHQYSWLANVDLRLTEETNVGDATEGGALEELPSSTARRSHRPVSTNATQHQRITFKRYEGAWVGLMVGVGPKLYCVSCAGRTSSLAPVSLYWHCTLSFLLTSDKKEKGTKQCLYKRLELLALFVLLCFHIYIYTHTLLILFLYMCCWF
ncbi:casein kinase 1 isoform 2 [Trypanosoma rangeli]|uniref:Casein kinase 1 isoform 2 n=1 Tax=Trypanosoma rangeli TaxID=5698 RepID=A0A3R7NRM9_TRYRA|nr:casein kinase 1 isoform 2 [Trypanosoma rangeli]RNF06647.1 casein kinase 1 isoform 2 [Trypanosoma rangeli]|eukprot:RNF06647.1 casein kinase 1 isoform 2 [Trypanosoma rangeli]